MRNIRYSIRVEQVFFDLDTFSITFCGSIGNKPRSQFWRILIHSNLISPYKNILAFAPVNQPRIHTLFRSSQNETSEATFDAQRAFQIIPVSTRICPRALLAIGTA